ncbi:MAG: hypothetical protein A2527_03185 [Candidatus Lambdaproteobacteria bacterium RIFOXYD2_FULL_50_16]|uniref:histidine kinase n=1 Tax=Candidatus Lambdaproteobacteria bacterium RIFOXYD2_FULL_50_16 TaxID=1817772 RepID=A0A1F6GEP9_9PROT|nr:MAG: hypothetical protein A2527_03185 [Candidatus Lambdaproteobacteria bacterium RIFOXYD2_FULL_50_16]
MAKQNSFINETNQELIDYMKSSRLFSHLPESLLMQLVPLSEIRTYLTDDEILVEGQENDRVFFMIRGCVEIYSGGEFILDLKRQGDLFGEMSVISNRPVSATVIAKTRVVVFTVQGRNIGRYTDIDVERINHVLYRLFAAVLTDKLALTTYKAKQYEIVNIYLNKTQQALAEKHKQLVKEKKAADAAADAKAAFIATMSHEVRTPLNGILGMTELLLSTRLDQEQTDFANAVLVSGQNLLAIINDILDFSKIDQDRLELVPQDMELKSLVEECLQINSPSAANKHLELFSRISPNLPPRIHGDPKRIAQVINNFLSNAIKFTAVGQVELLVDLFEADDGPEIRFQVKDSGIGIKEENHAELFHPFHQVDNSITRRHGGTGLGLAISKRLSELMQGRLWLESKEGQGSIFYFSIPLKPIGTAPAQSPLTPLPKGKNILFYEPGDEQRDNLETMMTGWGLSVTTYGSRAPLLERLKSEEIFHLVLLCLEPDEVAKTLIEKIYQVPGRQGLPIILTSRLGKEHLGLGIPNCRQLFKPIRERSLHRALNDLLANQSEVQTNDAKQYENLAQAFPLSIMLAEDNRINQKLFMKILAKVGYSVDLAATGLEVLELVDKKDYHLIFMDIQMPEMDGLTATKKIHAQLGKDKSPYIIALTANALEEDRQRYFEGGVDDYISKPFSQNTIFQKLKTEGSRIFGTPL